MRLLPIDAAIELIAFDRGTAEARLAPRDAYQDGNQGIMVYDFATERIYRESGQLELAGDIVEAAVMAGRLRLFGSDDRSDDPRFSSIGERVMVEEIPRSQIEASALDYWDDMPVLVSEDRTFLNLFVDADEFNSLFADLFSHREKRPAGEVMGGAYVVYPDTLETKGNPGTAAGESECRAWFADFVKHADKDGPGKRLVWTKAHARFGERLSYKGFLRVWDDLAPPTWKYPGRRRSRKIESIAVSESNRSRRNQDGS
jgi:hypothetical protein